MRARYRLLVFFLLCAAGCTHEHIVLDIDEGG